MRGKGDGEERKMERKKGEGRRENEEKERRDCTEFEGDS